LFLKLSNFGFLFLFELKNKRNIILLRNINIPGCTNYDIKVEINNANKVKFLVKGRG